MSSGPTGLISVIASPLNTSGYFEIPDGWLICDGRSHSKEEYLNLYNHLLYNGPNSIFNSSTNPLLYGGDSSNFNVPNLNNRFIRGFKTGSQNVHPGQYTQQEVNISAINSTINTAGLTLSNNDSQYSTVSQSISSAGEHNHMYGTSNTWQTTQSELSDTQGFFHTRALELSDTGSGYVAHMQSFGTNGEPCNLSYGFRRLWSIIQVNRTSLIDPSKDRGKFYTTMHSSQIWAQNGRAFGHSKEQANTNFRHNHQYSINVQTGGSHTHSVSAVSETIHHKHSTSINPTFSTTGTGTELRPANTKMLYIIYAK
jgi:hypothetical protein